MAAATVTKMKAANALDVRRSRVESLFQLDPQVSITLKGNRYTLEMNNWAVKGILKDTGLNLMSVGFGIEQMQDPEIMGGILFWTLATNHPDLDQDAVDKLFTYKHYSYVIQKLQDAIKLFLPDMSDIEIDTALGRTETNEDPQ